MEGALKYTLHGIEIALNNVLNGMAKNERH